MEKESTLTHKKILQRLPIALTLVKAGNSSENLNLWNNITFVSSK